MNTLNRIPYIWIVVLLLVSNNDAFQPTFGAHGTIRSLDPSLLPTTVSLSSALNDAAVVTISTDNAPSWSDLATQILATPTGGRLSEEADLRTQGLGPPHVDARRRKFPKNKTTTINVDITFHRDAAAWCPYCQKVWLMLEEKQIPHRVKVVPLNAYGDKPDWYTRVVDGGKLPALEMDGKLFTESLEIMKRLEERFADCEGAVKMIPEEGSQEYRRFEQLRVVEQELQRDWFSLVFYPVDQGEAMEKARHNFMKTLTSVDVELGATATGPWFLGGEYPSLLDLQFIPVVERIVASVLFWRGIQLRAHPQLPNLERWIQAWEERPSYLATRSDHYTLVKAIPSQNGPGYFSPDALAIADRICGLKGSWTLDGGFDESLEPLPNALAEKGPEAARHEAAFEVVQNYDAIVRFACRGAGEPGRPSYHAELADPFAEPNEKLVNSIDTCLRHVVSALLSGTGKQEEYAIMDMSGKAGSGELRDEWEQYEDDEGQPYYWNTITGDTVWTPPTKQVDTCLAYLRDRIGVPRDMGPAAAFQLRAHLNWGIGILNST